MNSSVYQPIGPVLIRTPALPYESLSSKILLESYAALIEAAIAISSRSLHHAYREAESPNFSTITADRYINRKLLKYLKRMATRCTPYGLFAGVALGSFSDRTDLGRSSPVTMKTKSRPDMSLICDLIERLEEDEQVRTQLSFRANPRLVLKNGRVWQTNRESAHEKRVTSVKATQAVMFVLQRTATRHVDFAALVRELIERFGVPTGVAEGLCTQLVDNYFLISNLRFPLQIADPLGYIVEQIQKCSALPENTMQTLESLSEHLLIWDSSPAHETNQFLQTAEAASKLAKESCSDLLQVDAITTMQGATISQRVSNSMLTAVELLLRLSTSVHSSLKLYVQAFERRYHGGRYVPLPELLDETFGLGSPYGDRYFHHSAGLEQSARNKLLLNIATCAQLSGTKSVDLKIEQIRELELSPVTESAMPLSVDLFCQLRADSQTDIDEGNFELLITPRLGDVCGGRAIGRFANMLGEEAVRALKQIRQAEGEVRHDCIMADGSFWTEPARVMNVALSPSSCEYSISAQCALSQAQKNIPLSEILVGIEEDRLCARWSKTGQIIELRAGHLLNPEFWPEELRFLFDLGLQGQRRFMSFDWGIASNLHFLPRITFENIILSPARWNVSQSLSDLQSPEAILTWQEDYGVPDLVLMSKDQYDDNCLLIDLSSPDDLLLLLDAINQSKQDGSLLMMQEFIPTYRWHEAGGVHYASELVASFVLASEASRMEQKHEPAPITTTAEELFRRPFGSEWLYIQLDSSPRMQEDVILKLADLCERMVRSRLMKKWFVVRYFDERHHLRVRFEVEPAQLYKKLLPAIASELTELLDKDYCSDFRIETYNREVERYGGNEESIRLAETMFAIDTEFVCELFRKSTVLDRRILGVISVNAILDAFAFDSETKRKVLLMRVNESDEGYVGSYYRSVKTELFQTHNCSKLDESHPYINEVRLSKNLRHKLSPFACAIKNVVTETPLAQDILSICDSIVHMHCNRMFGPNLQEEFIIRGLLLRVLSAAANRNKTGKGD